jgi:lysophospholipase L1-like esterase
MRGFCNQSGPLSPSDSSPNKLVERIATLPQLCWGRCPKGGGGPFNPHPIFNYCNKGHIVRLLVFLVLLSWLPTAQAQTITTSNVQIEWKVANRFRLFRDAETFNAHERAWRQYLIHVDSANKDEESQKRLRNTTSVLGTEHVLNDRYIPFTRILRRNYDPMGWAARQVDDTCWNPDERTHTACGTSDDYVMPKSHDVIVWLKPLDGGKLVKEYNCNWRVDGEAPVTAPCDEPVTLKVAYPTGSTVSVGVDGETPIATDIQVKDLLIAALGDSFASGEGNPDVPVTFDVNRRARNVYPKRAGTDANSNAQWLDELCHRSLYGHQLRAALQIAIENPKAAVTFMGYSCSGAAIDEGILGPQTYVHYTTKGDGVSGPQAVRGGSKDTQLRWLLRELCKEKPDQVDGIWTCPNKAFRRNVDFLLLSIGGNDIGFSNLVGWATLRPSTSATLAKFFGATVSAKQFSKNMTEILPGAYAKLAKAIETAVPLNSGATGFDPSRIVLTAYPDILEDETGKICASGEEGADEDLYPANQSLDGLSSWLVVTPGKLERAHAQLDKLHSRMGELAEDHGWSFAARAYNDRPFRGHGFCAQNQQTKTESSEVLMLPCWGSADRPTQTCGSNLSGKIRDWRPYNPVTEHYPFALRQRWVRSFNDAWMVINQKVLTRQGAIDEDASAQIFSETTGAMHPTAEGHAAMADAILMDLRPAIAAALGDDP